MAKKRYRYIYGPVASWRLGRSLGIDPISGKVKICSFNCIYCQLGKTRLFTDKRKVFVSAEEILKEIDSLPPIKIDYISFSGAGEPTLAKNLGQIIKAVKRVRKEKVAVLTNSSLIDRKDVQRDLLPADFVMAKLDAPAQDLYGKLNRPAQGLSYNKMVKGIKEFKGRYKGRLALQIMFVKDNKDYAKEIAAIAKYIDPDEVQINTPLRPSAARALSRKQIDEIKPYFRGMKVISVYDAKKKKTKPISRKATLKRRGKAAQNG